MARKMQSVEMTCSELAAALEAVRERHGDVPVRMVDWSHGQEAPCPVGAVSVRWDETLGAVLEWRMEEAKGEGR